MPIPLPNLDDRTYADLVAETRSLIPRYAPTWTDHNVSDPGITLIELFAWLTEALIYRLNRIPQASEARFLELLGATFQAARPATANLTVIAEGLTEAVIIRRGTPLVVDSGLGKNPPFETISGLELTPERPQGLVVARQTVPVRKKRLGVSTGRPNQVFSVDQFPLALKLKEPFSLVPKVLVDGTPWAFRSDLLKAAVSDACFTVEPHLNAIRFGDGATAGRIPPTGAEILVSFHRTSGSLGNVPGGTAFAFDMASVLLPDAVKQALAAGTSFVILAEEGATGGADPTSLDEVRERTISVLNARNRAITAEDFETLVLEEDFGGIFLGRDEPNVARVRCLPEVDLTASDPDALRPGHISVIVVPYPKDEDDKTPQPSLGLITNVWRFLDERRLITCRHHVVGPDYIGVCVGAEVVRVSQVPRQTVEDRIKSNLAAFFDPLTGGPAGDGWPFGRDVYASEVYQIIEATEGVDHVESLELYAQDDEGGWVEAGNRVDVAPNSLIDFVDFEGEPAVVCVRTER